MEIRIVQHKEEGIRIAADFVAARLRREGRAVAGFPTGSTPVPLYAELVRMHREDDLSFAKLVGFNCDEWVGIPPEHPGTYHYFMQHHFYAHVDVPAGNINIPDGLASDPHAEACRYEEKIAREGGIDVQFLGLGLDGHIAFNEPMSALHSRTRVKILSEEIRAANAGDFGPLDAVPHEVITIGIGTILAAKHVALLAFGEAKANIVATAFEGPLTAAVPASALQQHPHCTIILDEASASKLRYRNFHLYAQKRKYPC